jgi:hypothetical protein
MDYYTWTTSQNWKRTLIPIEKDEKMDDNPWLLWPLIIYVIDNKN